MQHYFDFIIVGSGLAGLNGSLEAAKHGTVLIVTKAALQESNTNYAQGGIASVISKPDNFKSHIQDTIIAGAKHNNRKAVEYVIKNGPGAIKKLIQNGVQFADNLHLEGGHSHSRIWHVKDFTGYAIESALIKAVKKHPKITILEKTFVSELLAKNHICYGAKIMKKNGKTLNIFAKRTVLATGGLGQLFSRTTNPLIATGDGIALAAKAGGKFKDLEFIQFHPTAFAKQDKGKLFLLSEALRGDGAKLMNNKGEQFMKKYHPNGELAPRDIVSRAIYQEEKSGQVFLDVHTIPNINKKFPKISAYLKTQEFILQKDLIPITPAAHFSCGGIATDLNGKTNIINLYAIGEVACTGLHGANRLASNSLLEAGVISNNIIKNPLPKAIIFPDFRNTELKKSSKRKHINLLKIRKQIQQIMWEKCGIIRSTGQLTDALKHIIKLSTQIQKYQLSKPKEVEVANMLKTSELIIKAALKRKKSLGAHTII